MAGKLLILLAAAVSAPSLAQGENWRSSSAAMGGVAYIDTASIRRNGNEVHFWREVRWPEVQTLAGGERYDRIRALYHGSCTAMTLRSLHVIARLQDRIVISGPDRGAVENASAGSTAASDLRAACFQEWPAAK